MKIAPLSREGRQWLKDQEFVIAERDFLERGMLAEMIVEQRAARIVVMQEKDWEKLEEIDEICQ